MSRAKPSLADDGMKAFELVAYGCEAETAEERSRRDREIAAEFALRDLLTRHFGSYALDGGAGIIRSQVPVSINFRELARGAVAHVDLVEGRKLRAAITKAEGAAA